MLIVLNDSHWQKVHWWKRYYTFKVYAPLVHYFFTSEEVFKENYFSKVRIQPGDEVVFDYKTKKLIVSNTIKMDYSNVKIFSIFKHKYRFTFTKTCIVDKYYTDFQYMLKESVLVEPNKIYILNTFFNTLKEF